MKHIEMAQPVVEPWLEARISNGRIKLWPKTGIEKCCELLSGDLAVWMNNDQKITIDRTVLATDYKVEFEQGATAVSGGLKCFEPTYYPEWLSGAERVLPERCFGDDHYKHAGGSAVWTLFCVYGYQINIRNLPGEGLS